ncbi:MAG TPA: hypothetical protein VF100_05785, partial [Thermoanaerobaculia bacterium]
MQPETQPLLQPLFDPYRPPEAPVGPQAFAGAEPADPPPFFAVSRRKLLVMSLATAGLYEIYWFYKHWQAVNRWEVNKVWPVARALFSPLFAYSLFERIRHAAALREVRAPALSSGLLALAYFLAAASWQLPSPADLASTLTVVPLLVVQGSMNRLHSDLGHEPRNTRFTGWNVAAIVFGALFWTLALAGL